MSGHVTRQFLLARRVIRTLPNRLKPLRTVANSLQRLYALGETDDGPRAVLQAYLPSDGVFVDVGANVGLYTCTMATHVYPSGHVFAIEPVPANVEALQRNVHLNQLGNVSIHPVALSDRAQRLELFAPAGHRGGGSGSISANKLAAGVPIASAHAVRLDDVFEGARLDAIKIDVEGHEPKVLDGAAQTLKRFRPIVMCEVNSPAVLDAVLRWGRELRFLPCIQFCGRLALYDHGASPNDLFLIPTERYQ